MTDLTELDPAVAAAQLARSADDAWIAAFDDALRAELGASQARRVLDVWGISQSEAGRLFGVSRQAVSKWMSAGLPDAHVEAFADLAAATDLLTHYLKLDRIPAVVRRPAPAFGGRSLLDMVGEGRTAEVVSGCRAMFQLGDVHR